MSHYTPGAGLKKPLNMLENPVYPDIKKGPPRFVWSRKHWNVDAGATMRDTEPYTQFIEPAVLAQSRSYNKTVYGQSSHKDVVNAEFRPPLISPYEDLGPLTRIPATIHAIIPHINPGTAGHGNGTGGYTAKNERASDIEGALTDRIKAGEWRPTFFAPMEVPRDNSILPDLEAKLPPISVHAGWNIPIFTAPQPQDIDLGDDKLGAVPMASGYSTDIKIDGPSAYENYDLYDNRPSVSATAGVNTPFEINTPLPVETYTLSENRPQVSASAGMNTPMQIDAETQVEELLYNRPQVSASAGMNTPVQINAETRVDELEAKLGETPINILNPGSETGFKSQTSMYTDTEEFIQQNRPNYSYVVPVEVPTFRTRNSETHQPHFKERLQPVKSYGQISQSGGAIPRMGVEMPREHLSVRKRHPYMVSRKPKQYRF